MQATHNLLDVFTDPAPAKLSDNGGAEELLNIFIPADPKAKQRPRMTRGGHVFTPKQTVDAETHIKRTVANVYQDRPYEGAIQFELIVWLAKPKSAKREHPTTRPDIDNFLKLACDALNGLIWCDDSQVCIALAEKAYCRDSIQAPGYSIVVRRVP
jgi:Holliday junction resolvase RusA-like endonuclease